MARALTDPKWGSVELVGPYFQAGQQVVTPQILNQIELACAQYALERVQQRMSETFQNPTGYYQNHVALDLSTRDAVVVSDHGVVYGPWLEGTSERNQRSRFKGYSNFRLAKQDANTRAPDIAGQIIAALCRELN